VSESPYAIPEEGLINTARVPATEQVIEQPDRHFYDDGWANGGNVSGDLDGDGD
jgi:hypothetical protein